MRARKTYVLVVAALVGCGDIIGLDGYGEGDGSITDATGGDTGLGDAKADVKASDSGGDTGIGDAGNDVVTACMGGVCVAPLPTGWVWAAYNADMRVGCATGYSSPTDVDEGIDASTASCGCGCTTTNPTCEPNKLTVNEGNNGGGVCNNGTNNQADVADGGCNALAGNVLTFGGGKISVATSPPSGGSCTAVPDASVPPVGFNHQGRTCGFTGTPGSGCMGGNVCLPNPAPFNPCVSQAGMNACPSGFPNQHLVGTMVDDTRGCTACSCTFDAGSCGGNVTFYTNNTCTTGAKAVATNSGCTGVNGNTFTNIIYAPSALTASCAASPVGADGGAVFGDLTTVCCQ